MPDPSSSSSAPADKPRRRSPPRRIEVSRVETLSPLMRRVTFGGADLAGFAINAPATYIKLTFPEPGQDEPPLPTPDGPRSMSMRTYTPRRFDASRVELDVDFVLHGDGPASGWAAQARVGQRLVLMGPGRGYEVDSTASSHLLIGDESALPALETILEGLPAHAHARVFVEVAGAHEERALGGAHGHEIVWLHRGADTAATGRAIEAALRRIAPALAPDTRAYVACEALAMRRIRLLLIDELKLPRAQVVGRGYWKIGGINHPDHDYGDDA